MFLKYTPTGWKKGNPVLFVLHGGHGSAGRVASEANFRKIADLKRILLIYPNGTGREGLGLTTNAQWNDGRNATTFPHARGIDDVGFLRKIASRLRSTGEAVSSNIFVTGVSNGGMMTQRLLCQASDVFSGGAAVIANMPLHLINNCRPRIARPVMIMNGTADSLMPYHGGVVGAQYGSLT